MSAAELAEITGGGFLQGLFDAIGAFVMDYIWGELTDLFHALFD